MVVQSPNNMTTADNMAVDCHALELIDSANLVDINVPQRLTSVQWFSRRIQYGDGSTKPKCSTLCDSKTKIKSVKNSKH